MPMTSLVAAAALTVIVSLVHSWLGERRLIRPLLAADPPPSALRGRFPRNVLRYAWHITSLAWVGMAGAMLSLAQAPLGGAGRLATAIIGVTFLLHAGLVMTMSRGRHLAWPVFLMIGLLCLWAAR